MTTALTNKHYSGHHNATEVEENQRTQDREVSTKVCGQLDEDRGDNTRQSWMIDKWSVTCDLLGPTRHKSSKFKL